MKTSARHYGKYRGTVANTFDPDLVGKITVLVTVDGAQLQLRADACTPYPGFYAIPPEGSGVWVEFEEGDLNKPIWTGCWWRPGELAAFLPRGTSPATASKTVALSVSAVGMPAVVPAAQLTLNAITGEATLQNVLLPVVPEQLPGLILGPAGVKLTYPGNILEMTMAGTDFNRQALSITPSP
jgi:hypothetical protein